MKAVADVMSAATSTAVHNIAHTQALSLRAEASVMPTCANMIGLPSEIAGRAEAGAAVLIVGRQAGSTVTVGSSASTDNHHSGSKRKASAHGDEFRLRVCSKHTTSCGGDVADLDSISVQYISPPSVSDAPQEWHSTCLTADRLSLLS
jgi:hypothetical protein